MKIKSVAAVGAMGVGLGFAGFLGAGTASAADPCAGTPPLSAERVSCLAATQTNTFISTVNPVNGIPTLIEGSQDDTDFGSLGLAHQGQTFVNSITGPGGFLDGPRNPDGVSVPDAPDTPDTP